jgi:NAD(P) transhydrogenase subunit beta
MKNLPLILGAIAFGGGLAFISAKRAAMTDMPQMIAMYNGMGGGAAACIALIELLSSGTEPHENYIEVIAIIGAGIGTLAFSGSIIAFAKLQGLIKRNVVLFMHNMVSLLLVIGIFALGFMLATGENTTEIIIAFFAVTFILGIVSTISIGGADMPVIISLYNAFTGLAVAMEGMVVNNATMIVAGTVVGASGTLLTHLMAKAMNRSLTSVLFSSFGAKKSTSSSSDEEEQGEMLSVSATDMAAQLTFCSKVVIVPGYGMAVAQAQHKLWEMCQLLQKNGIEVLFAIHPVAGRMPGHMNVLLAEAGVPYDLILDLEEVNNDFKTADAAIVIGANDVVNPSAKNDENSPIYGMPILDVDEAQHAFVIKRGQGAGFSGLQNKLFFADKTRMVYGDAQKVLADAIQAIKEE